MLTETEQNVYEIIKDFIKEKNVTRKDLEKITGLSRQRICQICTSLEKKGYIIPFKSKLLKVFWGKRWINKTYYKLIK